MIAVPEAHGAVCAGSRGTGAACAVVDNYSEFEQPDPAPPASIHGIGNKPVVLCRSGGASFVVYMEDALMHEHPHGGGRAGPEGEDPDPVPEAWGWGWELVQRDWGLRERDRERESIRGRFAIVRALRWVGGVGRRLIALAGRLARLVRGEPRDGAQDAAP